MDCLLKFRSDGKGTCHPLIFTWVICEYSKKKFVFCAVIIFALFFVGWLGVGKESERNELFKLEFPGVVHIHKIQDELRMEVMLNL